MYEATAYWKCGQVGKHTESVERLPERWNKMWDVTTLTIQVYEVLKWLGLVQGRIQLVGFGIRRVETLGSAVSVAQEMLVYC
jgi:hypothetical protein